MLVWSDTEVELGGTGRFIDTRAPSGRVFYAVYATDGTHMLSWTREGFNTGSTVRDGSGDASSPEEPLACGCSQGPAGATWVGLLGLGLVGLRRRR